MKIFGEKDKIITTYVDGKSLVIDAPLGVLRTAFEYSPENYNDSTINPRKEREFAELIAEHLHDEIDSEDGTTYIHRMFDSIFNDIFEGNIDAEETVIFGDEDEDEDFEKRH